MRPLPLELSLGVENLNAKILAVGDIDQPVGIDGNRVRNIELSFADALLAPGLEKAAVLRVFYDAGVAVAVADEDLAARADRDIGRAV